LRDVIVNIFCRQRRQKRQEEWEKVRTADQPEDAPEEPYDGRSLYERLKEQKDAKDLEFEESRKFKNMIRGLDDDEVDHLSEIENRKLNEERKLKEEEYKEIQDYRAKVAELQELSAEQKLNNVTSSVKQKSKDSTSRTSQKAILSAVVKRKIDVQNSNEEPAHKYLQIQRPSALKVAAVLPGIGNYKSSDESDGSSSDEMETLGLSQVIALQSRKNDDDENEKRHS